MPPGRPRLKNRQLESAPLSEEEITGSPSGLGERASGIWRALAPMLSADGRLSQRTKDSFIRYCKVAALFDECYDVVVKMKVPLVFSDRGEPKLNPAIQALRTYESMASSLADRFLMTPKALSQAGFNATTKDKNPFSEFDL